MDLILEQESNMNAIAALTLSAIKADANNHHTDYITITPKDTNECEEPAIRAAFHNLPPCDPIEISFKDLSYSVQKMFSKSKSLHFLFFEL